jgi:hypothetical protein
MMTVMTKERVDALVVMIEAVEALGQEPASRDNSPAEDRLFDALMRVRATGADVALRMPILTVS